MKISVSCRGNRKTGNHVIELHLPFALGCIIMPLCGCVGVCSLVFVSGLVNQSPFRQLLAADSTLSSAVCQVSFMLPVSADDALVPQVFYVTTSFVHKDSKDLSRQTYGKPHNMTAQSRCGLTAHEHLSSVLLQHLK